MKFILTFVACICIPFSSISFSQTLGLEDGISYNIQKGHFKAPCECTFAKGTGLGYASSLFFELPLAEDFEIGIASGIQNQEVTDYEVVPATLQRIADGDEQKTRLLYLNISPYVRYTIPSTAIFLRVAPAIQYLLSSEFHHTEGGTSGNSSVPTQTPQHGGSATDPVIDDLRDIRYAAKFSAGYDFNISPLILSPVLTYDLPLNTIRSNSTDNGWNISSFLGSVMLRFKL